MSNRCVAAGCGYMPIDIVSLSRFPKAPNLCGVWTRQVEQTRVDWQQLLGVSIASTKFQR